MSEGQKKDDGRFIVRPTHGTVLFMDGKLLPIGRRHRRMVVEWPDAVTSAELERMFADIREMIKPQP